MQTQKVEREKNNAQFAGHVALSRFCQRIGSTVYSVNIYCKDGEALDDKMWRMMQSDLNSGQIHCKMAMPQADALPEMRLARMNSCI